MEPSSDQLWQEAQPQVQLQQGILVVDDSTLDKLYAEKMELVIKIVTPDGDIDYWATNDLKLGELRRLQEAEFAWATIGVPSGTQAVL